MLPLLLTILGIGFLLFIHELGHFLAARAAGVRVEVFALGMGPRVFGFRRGDTDYRIAALPIGGYVQMKGEHRDDRDAPDSLQSKSTAARFFIYSGGIIMNFLFALVLIPILFRVGVPMQAPVVGEVAPGGAAWKAGLQTGDRIERIGERRIHSFSDFSAGVALADVDRTLQLQVLRPDGARDSLTVQPEYNETLGFPVVGVDPRVVYRIGSEGPAAAAGVEAGTRVVGIEGRRFDEDPVAADAILSARLQRGEPLPLMLEGASGVVERELVPEPVPTGRPQLGVFEQAGQVTALRDGHGTDLQPGDFVVRVGQQPMSTHKAFLAEVARAGGLPALTVERAGQTVRLPARPGLGVRHIAAHVALGSAPDAVRVAVRPDSPAARAGVQDGDIVAYVGNDPIDDFPALVRAVGAATADGEAVAGELPLILRRDGESVSATITLEEGTGHDYGLTGDFLRENVRETHLFAALGTGLAQARAMVRDVFLSFQRIVTGRISHENMGGIITIGRATHQVASNGLVQLLFFLCMISIHLGVLNLLPIPALDGGHLFFLLVEAVRGRPVSERVLIWFNLGGFVLVFGLIIFVTILDIGRLVQ